MLIWTRRLAWALALLFLAQSVFAQPALDTRVRDSLAWSPDNRHVADVLSTAMVVGAVAAPCLPAFASRNKDNMWGCLESEGLRVGLAIGVAELVKHVVHRTRPNGVDNKSFFSEHTAIACAATLHTKWFEFCPAVGYMRVAADWHWTSDVATGAAVGGLFAYTFK